MTTKIIPCRLPREKVKGQMTIKGKKIQRDFFLSRDGKETMISHLPSGVRILFFLDGFLPQIYDLYYLSDRHFSNSEIRRIANELRSILSLFPQSFEEAQSQDFYSQEAIATRSAALSILQKVAGQNA